MQYPKTFFNPDAIALLLQYIKLHTSGSAYTPRNSIRGTASPELNQCPDEKKLENLGMVVKWEQDKLTLYAKKKSGSSS